MQYILDWVTGQPVLSFGIFVAVTCIAFGIYLLIKRLRAERDFQTQELHRFETLIRTNHSLKVKLENYLADPEKHDQRYHLETQTMSVEEIHIDDYPVRHPRAIYGRKGEQGAILIVAMLILAMLTLLGMSSMQTSMMQEKMAKNSQEGTTAFQTAENGLAEARMELTTSFETVKGTYILNGNSYTGTQTFGHATFDYDFVQYYNEAVLGAGLEGFAVRSVGTTTTNAVRTVNQIFIHQDIPVNINSALSLHPAGSVTLKGNSTISGKDHNIPTDFDCNGAGCSGSLSSNPDVIGIYSETNVGDLTTIGSPTLEGAPATQTGGGAYDEAYWTDYANNVATMATVHNGADSSGSANWGTRDNPVVHVIDQNMMINSNLDGAGILIIRSDVVVNGNFHFEGLVLVASDGPVNFTVGGTARIFGATIAASPTATIDVGATGTPGILFSSEALANLNNINGVRATAWAQEM